MASGGCQGLTFQRCRNIFLSGYSLAILQQTLCHSLIATCPSVYPLIHKSNHRPTHPSIHPPSTTYKSIHPFVGRSVHPSTHPLIHLSTNSSVCPSVHPQIHPLNHTPRVEGLSISWGVRRHSRGLCTPSESEARVLFQGRLVQPGALRLQGSDPSPSPELRGSAERKGRAGFVTVRCHPSPMSRPEGGVSGGGPREFLLLPLLPLVPRATRVGTGPGQGKSQDFPPRPRSQLGLLWERLRGGPV